MASARDSICMLLGTVKDAARKIEFSPISQKSLPLAPTDVPEEGVVKESIQVYLRVKPTSKESLPCLRVLSDTSVGILPPKDSLFIRSGSDATTADKYFFNTVFSSEAKQEHIYCHAASPLIDSLFEGTNGLLFSYGPTNAGKTFTIQGTKDQPGILPRALDEVLARVDDVRAEARQQRTGEEFNLWATYQEIYNENVFDLLGDPSNRQSLKIKEENGVVVVKGLKEVMIRDASDAQSVLTYGHTNRQVAETMVNQDSSRSHSIFSLRLERLDQKKCATSTKLSIVDLAGSERSSKTQNTGARLKEASNINVSLMNLSRCLEALRWNQHHPNSHPHMVPFRQSKLTRLFQEWFTTPSRMSMLVNVSSCETDFEEMIHALKYGALARDIAVVTKVNSFKSAPSSGRPPLSTRKPQSLLQQQQPPQQQMMAWDADMQDMAAQIQQLEVQLYETETRAAQVEQNVREEVVAQMMEEMKDMEHSFAIRMENERICTEEKFQRKLDILVRESLRRANAASSCKKANDEEDSKVQLEYYKKRVDELQKEYKATLQKLMLHRKGVDTTDDNRDQGLSENSIGGQQQRSDRSLSLEPGTGDPTSPNELRVQYLEGEIVAVSRQLESTNAALAGKTQALADARRLLEEIEQLAKQTEMQRILALEQNDRLRESLQSSNERAEHMQEQVRVMNNSLLALEMASEEIQSQVDDEVTRQVEAYIGAREKEDDDQRKAAAITDELKLVEKKKWEEETLNRIADAVREKEKEFALDKAELERELYDEHSDAQRARGEAESLLSQGKAMRKRIEELMKLLDFNRTQRLAVDAVLCEKCAKAVANVTASVQPSSLPKNGEEEDADESIGQDSKSPNRKRRSFEEADQERHQEDVVSGEVVDDVKIDEPSQNGDNAPTHGKTKKKVKRGFLKRARNFFGTPVKQNDENVEANLTTPSNALDRGAAPKNTGGKRRLYNANTPAELCDNAAVSELVPGSTSKSQPVARRLRSRRSNVQE